MNNIISRRLAFAAALGLGLAFSGTVHAAPASVPAPAEAVQISAGAQYQPTLQEHADYLGRYKLSTGKVIEISQGGQRYYSQIDGRPPVQIYPRGPGVFITASGATLRFADNGDQLAISRPEHNLTAAR